MPRVLATLLLLCLAALPVRAEPVRTPHVEAQLVAERTAIVPGEPITLALRLAIIPEWHTYWLNPGDSGEPTALEWRLPAGYRAGDIRWPVPERLPAGPLLNYGYSGEVLHLVEVQAPANALPGESVTLRARATWLVCRIDCIPEDAELSLTLPVAASAAADSRWSGPIAATRVRIPAAANALSEWSLTAQAAPNVVVLRLAGKGDATLPEATRFFPFDQGKVEPAAPQRLARADGAYTLALPRAAQPVGAFDRVTGVLVLSPQGDARPRAFTIDVPVAQAPPMASGAGLGFVAALIGAFVGGLILNLMPCVLPVLAIKVLGFADADPRRGRTHGLLYAAGVLVSFWALAGLLLALRAAGAELGWGFQLQSPVAVALLALVFFGLALNLSGVFEFAGLVPSRLATFSAAHPSLDWFLTGVLAVVVAAPCTAPFMGAALGYAMGAAPPQAFGVFTALGVGMALPYVVLAWFPALLARMPRPGAWMLRLKQALAFPLYATAVWLAWVLGRQAGVDGVTWLLAAATVLAFGAWLAGLPGARGPMARAAVGVAIAAAGVMATLPRELPPSAVVASDAAWQPYSAESVAALAGAGKPVFIDFTAAWCVTCQVNKKLVLSREDVIAAFRDRGVTLVRADWTRRDAEIAQALAAIGRSGVPAYVLYRPGRAPLVLPELLTRERVLEALDS